MKANQTCYLNHVQTRTILRAKTIKPSKVLRKAPRHTQRDRISDEATIEAQRKRMEFYPDMEWAYSHP